ncbi:MAG: hypothetical protein RMY16_28610 [Nostoc sp. DedQUE12b]|uniref:hypothetical protein n=1 Tax=Nostoc sp. DedQUE12b TaxID=3075398 RepID=UPI002AD432C1|nr:hypothetical protein [Nostoc sp. DedQUE12b]MDZ8089483.1 hypothetical protein [Nostoc sp. DedQUE12b]
MSGNWQQYIDEHLATVKKLQAEQEAERQKAADEKRVKAESRKATMKFLEQFIDTAIKFGTLTPEQVSIYLTNYRLEYGDNALVAKYLGLVVQLITHPQTGVESTTARFGNGGLIWRGQTYKNCRELHESLVALMADFDPFDNNIVWLEYLLQDLFEDESKLAAAPFRDTWPTEVILIRQLVEQSKNAVEIPDIDNLTTDDMFIIQSLVGGF